LNASDGRARLKSENVSHKLTEPRPQQRGEHARPTSAMEQEWAWFKRGMQQARRQQELQADLRARQEIIDGLGRMINPPQPQEPEIIVVEQGTGRLGYSDFDPALMAKPHRWW
jgi:hypothetical protein